MPFMDSVIGERALPHPQPETDQETNFTPADIRRLNGAIRSIDQYFIHVTSDLKRVNGKARRPVLKLILPQERTPLEHVSSRWQKLHEQFKDLIAESRNQAMVTWALLEGFDRVATSQDIRSGGGGLSDLRTEIDAFIDAMATQVHRATTVRERLRILIQEVYSIRGEVENASKATRRQEADLFGKLSQTLCALDQLKSSFSRISKEYSALKRACIKCISAVISAAPSEPPLNHLARTDAAIILSTEIRQREEEAADMVRSRNAARERLPFLEDAEKDIEYLAKNIAILPDIWNFIKVSLMEVNALLQVAVVGDHTAFFNEKLDLATASYKKLSAILHAYASDSER
ncbi:hypothetical protein C8Q73DRAFT_711303 [Cubamyces lactineus]|nr:hypothetical protein C8Q73DRAFT_711303 [Cubamyces lactineus]